MDTKTYHYFTVFILLFFCTNISSVFFVYFFCKLSPRIVRVGAHLRTQTHRNSYRVVSKLFTLKFFISQSGIFSFIYWDRSAKLWLISSSKKIDATTRVFLCTIWIKILNCFWFVSRTKNLLMLAAFFYVFYATKISELSIDILSTDRSMFFSHQNFWIWSERKVN